MPRTSTQPTTSAQPAISTQPAISAQPAISTRPAIAPPGAGPTADPAGDRTAGAPAAETAALAAADLLNREVVTATTADPAGTASATGRQLRAAAAMILAGLDAACRQPDRGRALRTLAALDRRVQRLGVWLDLHRRSGETSPAAAAAALAARGELRIRLELLTAEWRRQAGGGDPTSAPAGAPAAEGCVCSTLELSVPGCGG